MSCHESDRSISISKSETRALTLFDQRFPGNIKDIPPLEWRRIPGTQMRIINYLAGPDDSVQIFLGQSGGGILPNANRWLGQFGLPQAESFEAFQTIKVLERETYLIEAKGNFGGGMGQEPKKNQGLIGFIRPSGQDVITLKMTGPADAVAAERDRFMAYSKSLKFVSPQLLSESEESESE